MASDDQTIKNPLAADQFAEVEDDNDDLFVSTFESQPMSASTLEPSPASVIPAMKTISLDDEDAKAAETKDVLEDESEDFVAKPSVEEQQPTSLPSALHTQPPAPMLFKTPEPESPVSTPVLQSKPPQASLSREESQETRKKIKITIGTPSKIGNGVGSYLSYSVHTETNLPYFRNQTMDTVRRFSDFLALHNKLAEKYIRQGRILPVPPSKNITGTAKVKMGKEENADTQDFVEKRRCDLQRYIQRIAAHPVLCADPDFREFLELASELPRSTSTATLSSESIRKYFANVGTNVSKLIYKTEEVDDWFNEMTINLEALQVQLDRMEEGIIPLFKNRSQLAINTNNFAVATAVLSNCEENSSLSCALSQLATAQEKAEKTYAKQAHADHVFLKEMVGDYVDLITSIKTVLSERVSLVHSARALKDKLASKRDAKTRLESIGRLDKSAHLNDEIQELEEKLRTTEESLDRISKNIKEEFKLFDLNRIQEFKENAVKYVKSMLEAEQELAEIWEAFLPETQAISV